MSARSVTWRSLVCLCVLAGVAMLCVAPAWAARGHAFASAFGGAGSAGGQFGEPDGVAVDEATGDVYVVDKANNRVEYFSSSGAYLGQFDGSGLLLGEGKAAGSGGLPGETETGRFSGPEGIAIDNSTDPSDPSAGDVYVVDAGHAVIDKFSSTGEYLAQFTGAPSGSFGELDGVAVDSKGTVWVTGMSGLEELVDSFNDGISNELLTSNILDFSGYLLRPGLAVDSKDDLYPEGTNLVTGLRVLKYDDEGHVLGVEVDKTDSTGVAVESASDDLYIDNVETVARFTAEGRAVERFGAGHLSHGAGVAVNFSSGTVYVADSTADVVDVFPIEPPSEPTVETESVSNVTATSATLQAEINPRGANTEYHFEYGPCASGPTCTAPVPDGQVGSDFGIYSLSLHPQDLTASTAYHFRVVAHNQFGTVAGEESAFTTQSAGTATTLPDGRAWEMVSPPDKRGAQIYSISQNGGEGGVIQSSAGGNAITYVADAPTESEPAGYTNFSQVFSTRDAGGWQSRDIAIPHDSATGISVGKGQEYRFFSEDLSQAAIQPFGAFMGSLSAEASEQTPYLRSDYASGDVTQLCASSCYRPLVTGAPGYANVPAGISFGGASGGACPPLLICGPEFLDATPDLSHVLLRSRAQLTPVPTSGEEDLYEWSAGRLVLVSALSDGEAAQGPTTLGSPDSAGHLETRHALSGDGSRVIWSDGSKNLFMRDMRDVTKSKTVQLDVVQGGSGEGQVSPIFQIASGDGSRVFFTDQQKLTGDSGARSSQPDLYECEIVEEAGEPKCKLSDLTPSIAGESASVQGSVLGAGEDGSSVYFVADGALAPGAVKGTCTETHAADTADQSCNLFVRRGTTTSLVAVVSGADWPDWNTALSHQTARVSPNGRWLAFMSQRDLTGYDTRDVLTGKPDEELYLYDADAGDVECASCNPTGSRPVGEEYRRDALYGGDRVWETGTSLAADIPGWTPFEPSEAVYQSRFLSNSGRLFFNGRDVLVPQDVNGTWDVYEYEPPGVGGCSRSSVTFSGLSGGCVGLISSGGSTEESGFLDASTNGDQVFFLTSARLSPQDYDTAVDIYDAQECTTGSPCPAPSAVQPPPCTTGDSCKPAPSPQPEGFGSPASATFSGAGNVVAGLSRALVQPRGLTRGQKLARALRGCRRKRGRQRSACLRRARARYAARRSSVVKASGRQGR
jgi:hypothetical protein